MILQGQKLTFLLQLPAVLPKILQGNNQILVSWATMPLLSFIPGIPV